MSETQNRRSISSKLESLKNNTFCDCKVILKHGAVTMTADTYLDKDDVLKTNVKVELKGITTELANKVIDVMGPYFEDPYKQLELPFEVVSLDKKAN